MKEYKCQMTVELKEKVGILIIEPFYRCDRPAKYIIPGKINMGVQYVCGIHKNEVDRRFKRIGSKLRCTKLEKRIKDE